jgi:hypothetical protein
MDRGIADRALMYARDGVRLPDVPEAQHAWMRLRKARTLALVRDQKRVSRDELESILTLLQEHGFPGQPSFDVADMMASVGIVLNSLELYAEAHSKFDQAVTLLGGSSPLLQSRCLAQQVIAALRISQPSLAADHMLDLARVVPLVDSRRLDGYVRDVFAESARWATVPEVRDARDHLKHLAMLQ